MKYINLVTALIGLIVATDSAIAKRHSAGVKRNQLFFLYTSFTARYIGTRTQAQDFFNCNGYSQICARAYTTGLTHTPVPAEGIFEN